MAGSRRTNPKNEIQHVAANGLLDRRALLSTGVLFAGAAAASGVTGIASAAAEPLAVDTWSLNIGAPIPPYSTPSKFESKVIRTIANPDRPGNNQSRTPHHL